MSKQPKHGQDSRAEWLVNAVIDGTATADDVCELDRLLQSTEEVRRYYRDASELHASLHWIHRANEAADLFDSSHRPASLSDDAPVASRARRTRGAWSSIPIGKATGRLAKAAMPAFTPSASLRSKRSVAAFFVSVVGAEVSDAVLSSAFSAQEIKNTEIITPKRIFFINNFFFNSNLKS